MIKKFNKFISEEYLPDSVAVRLEIFDRNTLKLFQMISREDIEDQFLRLTEILHYSITINEQRYLDSKDVYTYYEIRILPNIRMSNAKDKKASDEFNQIIIRMKSMYPEIKIDSSSRYGDYITGIYIRLKDPIRPSI